MKPPALFLLIDDFACSTLHDHMIIEDILTSLNFAVL